MPDLLAGSTVRAIDTPPTVADTQDDLFTFDSTTFGIDADTGTHITCGVTFLAPTTGRVKVDYVAELDNSAAAASTNVAPAVREGAVIGSGTQIVGAALATAIRNVGTDSRRYSGSLLVEGLTPGATYNVRLEHRVSGGTGAIQFRHVIVAPAT